MFRAYGLYSHIQANRIRSAILLAGFVALLHALLFSLLLIWSALLGGTFDEIVAGAWWQFGQSWPVAIIAAAIWFGIAYFIHQWLVRRATGAKGVTRAEAPQLYNALENLCISRGIPMPALHLIETPALNAYASGLREGQYVIAVTRGLVDALAPDELEAVLAHELTHIRNGDAQLMVIAVIFAGVFAFFGDLIIRMWDFPYGWSPTPRRQRSPTGWTTGSDDDGWNRGGRSRDGGGAALVAIAVAIAVILITWGISTLIRFALSRSREFLADAGSAELTKNPDALVRALRKIEGHARFDVPSRMEAFFIENPVSGRLSGLLATHPPIADRIEALQRYAGAAEEAAG
ncbi:MAG TPA: M48 family metallopeptidase [Hyphomicrobiaceae bacterium]|jgi:heat shock protein HtpX|nr:M48 family metallopeptidase [Hyphomicrobiaceae bacterium]